MKKFALLPLAAITALAACSPANEATTNEVAANETMSVDENATMAETMDDLNATVENGTDATEAALENAAEMDPGVANTTNAM